MKKIETKMAPAAIGPYSQAVVVGNLIFTSGQISLNPENGLLEGENITEQSHRVCKNLQAVLTAAGGSLKSAVKTVCFLSDIVILIMNNGVLGMVRQWQTLFYNKHYSNTVLERKTDFAAFVKAFGAEGEAVSTPEELDAALGRAFKTEGPYIIDCKIDKDEFVLPMLPPGGSMDDIITKLEASK